MSNESESILAELLALLAEGRKIEAIKRYREVTGAGLAAAKETVEALERGEPLPTREPVDSTMEAEIISLLEGGKKIEAIKVYRERTGVGLKEAKDAVEAVAAQRGIIAPSGSGCLGVVLLLMAISVAACTACGQLVSAEPPRPIPSIEVFFSPKGGCTDAIIKELKAAKTTVLVQAYWFTSASIAKALVEAHKRGVRVEVILDRSRTEIDNDQAEEENVENLLVIRDKRIADKFTANWKAHVQHSGRYRKG